MVQNRLTGRVLDGVDLVAAAVPGSDAGNPAASGPGLGPAGDRRGGATWFALAELAPDPRSPAGSAGSLLVRVDRR